ncbi:hypothetical protein QL992_17685 [Microbacterium sp. APC 3898]|uniref:Uncharacterized protein n=1 Tax=Planococcus notacanthi TaxID=3035188 RepID=A0ABT7ZPR8_9BACL|nr:MULTISPECIES: hypothetical protein [Terrabacteria group]MDN3429165.1 hypothetical protein [Planococcus sp. APC 4016]MDN3501056.1 hypothetical protein [Microbacterium sp. APC 3898]
MLNFIDFKKYECPDLKITPKVYNEERLEKIRWMRGLNKEMGEFRVDFSDSHLKKNEIIVPIFVDDMLLPITYTSPHKKDSKFEPKSYYPFANYVFFEVSYRRGHLTKVTHNFGIRTFNDNDEKYLKAFIIEKVEYHFEYDFQLQIWKWAQHPENIKKWESEKEKIDLLFEADEVIEVTKKYFSSREKFEIRHINSFKTYEELLNTFQNLLKFTIQFIQLRKFFGEINKLPFEKMTSLLNEASVSLKLIQKDVKAEKLTDYHPAATNSIEFQINNRISNLHTSLKSKIFEPGYWVIAQHVYPNIGEYYNLSQKAKTNRTTTSSYELTQRLIEKADGRDLFIPLSSIDI